MKKAHKHINLVQVPSGGVPDDVRQWLDENNSTDKALADAISAVRKKVGRLICELNDPDNGDTKITKYDTEYDA